MHHLAHRGRTECARAPRLQRRYAPAVRRVERLRHGAPSRFEERAPGSLHFSKQGRTRDRVRRAGALSSCGACAASHQGSIGVKVNQPIETVPQSVPVNLLISVKYWSEWQELNLRPLVPNEGLFHPPPRSATTAPYDAGSITWPALGLGPSFGVRLVRAKFIKKAAKSPA